MIERYYVAPLSKLIDSFAMFPGIGYKTARRLALFLLSLPDNIANEFAENILEAKSKIINCNVCHNFTDQKVCKICSDESRDKSIICVVESPREIISIENTNEYFGQYHVLHGLISPMDGITPEDLKIKELLHRLDKEINEVIVATNSTVEGEATAIYIAKILKPMEIKVSRIAHGIPVGGDLEFADSVTLTKALDGRVVMC